MAIESAPTANFGRLLRNRRSHAELTQEELAQKSGVSVRAISDMETGRTRRAHLSSARLLADAMNLSGSERQHFIQVASGARDRRLLAARSATVPVPRQLPPTLSHFAARKPELAALDGLLPRESDCQSAAIVVIAGTAGVGKTALAVHWARRVRDRFPDGQLYVNLRGFGPTPPTPVARVLRGFLEGLGVPPERVPTDPDDQAAMYRSLLADLRMLILLDDAHEADQVRPLLPGTPGCAVLVTSRMRLTGLVASDGASELTLNVLSESDARRLLTRRLGAARLAAEPDAAREVIAASAGLPLALAIIAAVAARNPESSLGELAARYAGTRNRLDAFSTGEMTTDLRTLFSWSYRSVSPAAARIFRLLGVHPGPDISLSAATRLAGLPPEETGRLLAELTTAHLVTEHRRGRFALHDLLRIYATELSRTGIAADDGRLANSCSLDHYLRSA